MKPRTVKAKSKEQEEDIATWYGGRRSPSSGAQSHDKGDVVESNYLIECKYTEGLSISIKKEVWEKIRVEASQRSRYPLIALRFRDEYDRLKKIDLVVISLNEHLSLLERIEELEEQNGPK